MKNKKGALMPISATGETAIVIIIGAALLASIVTLLLSVDGISVVNRDLLSAAAKDIG